MDEINLKPKERLIDYDRVNTDIYCLMEGIIRLFHVEEHRENHLRIRDSGNHHTLSPFLLYEVSGISHS